MVCIQVFSFQKFEKVALEKFKNYILGISVLPPEKKDQKEINVVIVVDDSTPKDSKFYRVCKKIKKLAASRKNIVCLRTPSNKLKAGALNFGLDYINVVLSEKPNVVITLDDDVVLNKETVPEMIKTLYSEVSMGAVCSMARVKNKNKNICQNMPVINI